MDLAMTLKTRMVQAQFLEVFDFLRSFAMLCQFPAKNYKSIGGDLAHLKGVFCCLILSFGGNLT